jgi:Ca2+-binding EF-hand superfamily protein
MRTATVVAAMLAAAAGATSPARAAEPAAHGASAATTSPAARAQAAAHRHPAAGGEARGPSPTEIRRAFDAADLDHDGYISLEEFHKNALQAFNALDTDHDGYISREELAPLPRALRQSLLGSLRHADQDGDLRLSFKEVMEARMADFAAADTDGDGRLSLREVLDFHSKRSRMP